MKTITTVIQASDMKCHGCANAAKTMMQKIPGVQTASVDLAAQTVTVEHELNVQRESLTKALTRAGFPAE